jgi:hypothetical protein
MPLVDLHSKLKDLAVLCGVGRYGDGSHGWTPSVEGVRTGHRRSQEFEYSPDQACARDLHKSWQRGTLHQCHIALRSILAFLQCDTPEIAALFLAIMFYSRGQSA